MGRHQPVVPTRTSASFGLEPVHLLLCLDHFGSAFTDARIPSRRYGSVGWRAVGERPQVTGDRAVEVVSTNRPRCTKPKVVLIEDFAIG